MADFDSVPLFMRDLPGDDSGNVAIEALQALVYEGTPDGESSGSGSCGVVPDEVKSPLRASPNSFIQPLSIF